MPDANRRARCGAYRCQCPAPHAVTKRRDYDVCACGHSTLSHERMSS